MAIRFDRAPSSDLLNLFRPGGFLAPLLRGWFYHDAARGETLPMDLQFREKNNAKLYVGMTSLLNVQLQASGCVRVSASPTYTRQPCAYGLFGRVGGRWDTSEPGFERALEAYLASVVVGPSWLWKEGVVQASWMSLTSPWIALDREAVLGGVDSSHGAAVCAARREVEALASSQGWAVPKAKQQNSNELDQIAVGPGGELVLAELKYSGARDVYYAPLQLLAYVHEWDGALASVYKGLVALFEAKRTLGLVPQEVPVLKKELRPVVAWGKGSPSQEQRRRFELVLGVVNAHLPSSCRPVEVWALEPQGVPYQVR